ncbi:MAG: CDP-diacylglycerol--glycerol-3-phosphate 3-phosphatidyltransferase [Bacilli bacterium]|jgi:CDP-diacylglycerol--glycerol-3-phosphate 3-phosphatidyltransferase|nr:CDP-diacylglycerol--glycerol-3-phosphate 3-phosphatidyltransferase [Acholeplasmataceae bacterium]
MNLPNKITVFRFILIPIIIVISVIDSLYAEPLIENLWVGNLIIFVLFAVGAFSDFLDGYLARKHNLVTTFGKFMDPLADKMLVMTVLIILMVQQDSKLAPWVVIVIMAREFMVMGIRTLAAGENKIIAASKIAKVKTTVQFFMVFILLLGGVPFALINETLSNVIEYVLIYAAAILTIVSGLDYFIKNKEIVLKTK